MNSTKNGLIRTELERKVEIRFADDTSNATNTTVNKSCMKKYMKIYCVFFLREYKGSKRMVHKSTKIHENVFQIGSATML